ncbi:MAG: DUF4258 domain-containing protein [Planctomycetes bacterium]|nr:DUF4258 domain-containing protein [Planctomycetota bacterium]
MKPIRLSAHAASYLARRGFTVAEVEEAIRAGRREQAELGRLGSRKEFPFNDDGNGRWYATKQVRPIFIEGADEIIVITIYVYYY